MAKPVYDPLIDELLLHEHTVTTGSSDPASGLNGQWFINTTSAALKIYYGGAWQTLHTLTPPTDYFLLMETGDYLLLETGDKIILE